MKCFINPKILSLYIDDRLPKAKADLVTSHIYACPSCRKTLSNLESSKTIVRKLTPIEVSAGFDFEFRRKLNDALAKKETFNFGEIMENALCNLRDAISPKIPVLARAAAGIVIIISLGLGSINFINSITPGLSYIKGDVEFYSKKLNTWSPAVAGIKLSPGDIIKTSQSGIAEFNLKNMYKVRIKEGSELIVVKPSLSIAKKASTQYMLLSGRVLTRIDKPFKGRMFEITTPQSLNTALGTQFAVNVTKNTSEKPFTWLGVLEGSVKVESKYKKEGANNIVLVSSGQKTVIAEGGTPLHPEALLENEWNDIKELYQLGQVPQVALLISISERRARELLRPASLYIYDKTPKTVSPLIKDAVKDIITAIKEKDIAMHYSALNKIKSAVEKDPEKSYNANILLFVAAYYEYLNDHKNALETFENIYTDRRFANYASLAKCAEAIIYDDKLKETDKAIKAYGEILAKYPDSPEAKFAKEELRKIKIRSD